ncbi:MAG: hypothetical protein HN380_20795 [Victivallales bacterium]|jgi:hypothetical protein|nr:hypothetical protein [Victivallales bacterium]
MPLPIPRHPGVALTYALLLALLIQVDAMSEDVQRQAKSKWVQQPTRTVAELAGFTPGAPLARSRYGGILAEKREATGFFRTEKVAGRWWLVDPEGCRFVSMGVCSVNLSQGGLAESRLGDEATWATATAKLLRKHGFNTLGCWSDWQHFTGEKRLPYTRRWNFMSTFGRRLKVTHAEFGHTGYNRECMPVFHPDFEAFCHEHAKKLAETKDDPWLLGHFSDNELPFRPNSLDNYLGLSKETPGHTAAQAWWDVRRKKPDGTLREGIEKKDQAAFLEFLAKRYYTVVGAAIRKADPNHLYLGSRLHGRCIAPPVFRASKAVDVVSVNYYHRWTPEAERIQNWSDLSDRPILMSEWYAMTLDSAERKTRGAGFRVSSDRERGLFYQNYTLGLLAHPACVGWHWFKYGGDSEGIDRGIVNRVFEPYAKMLGVMGQLNHQAYRIEQHLREAGKEPAGGQ